MTHLRPDHKQNHGVGVVGALLLYVLMIMATAFCVAVVTGCTVAFQRFMHFTWGRPSPSTVLWGLRQLSSLTAQTHAVFPFMPGVSHVGCLPQLCV
jgi:hypothetical protein